MSSFVSNGFGRILVLNLFRGDLLLETIRGELKKEGIKDGVLLGAIGSLEKAVIHRVMDIGELPKDEFITIEKPMELSSLQGIIADGEPHFHIVISDLENVYTGHLEEGTSVLYLVEITIAEVKGLELKRTKNQKGINALSRR